MSKLTLLSGLPGVGKSTYRKKFLEKELENTKFIVTDDLREELFGFRDQTRNPELWSEVFKRCREYAKEGYDVVIDALNISAKDRRRTLSQVYKSFDEFAIIQFITPLEEIMRINKLREGTEEFIPWDVITNKITAFEFPLLNEGFQSINFVCRLAEGKEWNPNDYLEFYQDNPHHNETLGMHTWRVFRNSFSRGLFEVAKYHDCGKVYAKRYNEEKGYHQYLGHANASCYWYMSDLMGNSYKVSNYQMKTQTIVRKESIEKDNYRLIDGDLFYENEYVNLCLIKYHDLIFSKNDRDSMVEYFVNKRILPATTEIQGFVEDLLLIHEGDVLRVSDKQAKDDLLEEKLSIVERDLEGQGNKIIYVELEDEKDFSVKAIVTLSLEEVIDNTEIVKSAKHTYGSARIFDIRTYGKLLELDRELYGCKNQWTGSNRIHKILESSNNIQADINNFLKEDIEEAIKEEVYDSV